MIHVGRVEVFTANPTYNLIFWTKLLGIWYTPSRSRLWWERLHLLADEAISHTLSDQLARAVKSKSVKR